MQLLRFSDLNSINRQEGVRDVYHVHVCVREELVICSKYFIQEMNSYTYTEVHYCMSCVL